MQAALALLEIPHHQSAVSEYVTMSFGIALIIPDPNQSPRDLIAQADQNLYQAKHKGKNCIVG